MNGMPAKWHFRRDILRGNRGATRRRENKTPTRRICLGSAESRGPPAAGPQATALFPHTRSRPTGPTLLFARSRRWMHVVAAVGLAGLASAYAAPIAGAVTSSHARVKPLTQLLLPNWGFPHFAPSRAHRSASGGGHARPAKAHGSAAVALRAVRPAAARTATTTTTSHTTTSHAVAPAVAPSGTAPGPTSATVPSGAATTPAPPAPAVVDNSFNVPAPASDAPAQDPFADLPVIDDTSKPLPIMGASTQAPPHEQATDAPSTPAPSAAPPPAAPLTAETPAAEVAVARASHATAHAHGHAIAKAGPKLVPAAKATRVLKRALTTPRPVTSPAPAAQTTVTTV